MHGDAPDQPGATGRGYRIERFIGMGGAAAVYEARRLGPSGPDERVACKVIHPERRDTPGFRTLVWQEAVLGLRVTAGHPNLVEILDFFDDAREQLCIVMELVDGASLAELREPGQRLPFPIVRRIAVEVLEALAHLHGRGVLYRDLSLRNILVTAGGAVKVTDFGIARMMERGQVHTSNIRGTAVYLSAEAIERLPLDARSDLFSLGAVVYDLVAGQPPCGYQEQATLGAVFARNLAGRFEALPPDTPADLAALITGLILPDRNARRPQTAAATLALLRGCAQPMASHEELAALVEPAQARRDQVLADHPANVLPPGHVLAPRDDRDPAERAAGAPPGRMAGREAEGAVEVLPARVAGSEARALPERVAKSEAEVLQARVPQSAPAALPTAAADMIGNPLPELVAYFGADMLAKLIDELPVNPPPELIIELVSDGAPDRVAEHALEGELDAVPEHIDDVLPDALADRAPAPVAGPAADAQPAPVAEGASGGTLHRRPRLASRFLGSRAVRPATIGACLLVLGSLLDDGFRGEQATIALTPSNNASMPAGDPGPATPVAPAPVTTAEPHRAMERVDDLRRKHIESRSRRAGRSRVRREYVPPGNEPPLWGQQ